MPFRYGSPLGYVSKYGVGGRFFPYTSITGDYAKLEVGELHSIDSTLSTQAIPRIMAQRATSRRGYLKLLGAVSTGLVLLPFVPSGDFLVPPRPYKPKRVKIGHVDELPVDSARTFWFPPGTEKSVEGEFTNLLVHLNQDAAKEAGGEFVAYNRTCIHLRCLVGFFRANPNTGTSTERKFGVIACPCHGSKYRPTDGWPIAGPASMPGYQRYLPNVKLDIDRDGNIYAVDMNLDLIGYGSETAPTR